MKFGVFLPNYGPFGDPGEVADLAALAERSGWDGFFLWDHIHLGSQKPGPMVDPWVTLAAVATATSTIRLGPLITPLARRRPWKVARETVTLDHLSGGRTVLGVGLGHPADDEFGSFGEDPDRRRRALALDEGLDVLRGLWKGKPFNYSGQIHKVQNVCFEPPPLQQEIPIWGAGWWPNKAPFRRAARLDGVAPELIGGDTPDSSQVGAIRRYVSAQRQGGEPFDIVINGSAEERDSLASLEAAGATWWLERFEVKNYGLRSARERIQAGPR